MSAYRREGGGRRTLDGAFVNANVVNTATPNSIDGQIDNRGFTGHEMLDALDLVHMNGRIYEPMLGRFLSADPLIQDPMNGQSYNRYSYVLNNPTNLTDPTGFACEKTTGSNICDTTQATTLASGNYKYEGANGKMHYVVNHKEVDGTTGKPIAAPATKSDNLLNQANPKDGGATPPTKNLSRGDIYQSHAAGAGNALANVAVGIANILIAFGDPAGNADLIAPVKPFTPISNVFGHQGSEITEGLLAVSGARGLGAGVASKVEGTVADAAANLSKAKGVTNPDIPKFTVPGRPEGMTQAQFGKDLIGWGRGPEGAATRNQTVNRDAVRHMQSQGLTREMASQWRAFYAGDLSRNANNLTAKNRIQLMDTIIGYLK